MPLAVFPGESITPVDASPPDGHRKRLDTLPPLTQEQDSWCWAACLQMILRHYGNAAVQQCDLASTLCGETCCAVPAPATCNTGAASSEQVVVLEAFGRGGTPVSGAALFDTVRAEIDADRPLTAGLEIRTTRHRVVVRGWDDLNDEWVDICDPDNNGKTGQARYLDLTSAFGTGRWYSTMLDIQ